MAEPTADDFSPPQGEEGARFRLRTAGYCVLCDRIVERSHGGACPAGHPADAVTGSIHLGGDEPLPQLPRFNIAAFALPVVWGPAHGQWVGLFFLPIWLFADSALAVAGRGWLALSGAVAVAAGTLVFQAVFAKRANGLGWRRVSDRTAVDEFAARQRRWAAVCVPMAVLLLGWATYYRLVVA